MTAPQPATPGSDSVRAQIAQLLLNTSLHSPHQPNSGAMALEQADALVPLVNILRAEAKAEALDEAADHCNRLYRQGEADWIGTPDSHAKSAALGRNIAHRRDGIHLAARAAAYRTNPSSEETH